MKLYPRCHPNTLYNKELDSKRGLSYIGTDYLLPCCWCDKSENYEEFKNLGMFDDELKLTNVNSVKEILLSKQWINFHKILLIHPENSPTICKRQCSREIVDDE